MSVSAIAKKDPDYSKYEADTNAINAKRKRLLSVVQSPHYVSLDVSQKTEKYF